MEIKDYVTSLHRMHSRIIDQATKLDSAIVYRHLAFPTCNHDKYLVFIIEQNLVDIIAVVLLPEWR